MSTTATLAVFTDDPLVAGTTFTLRKGAAVVSEVSAVGTTAAISGLEPESAYTYTVRFGGAHAQTNESCALTTTALTATTTTAPATTITAPRATTTTAPRATTTTTAASATTTTATPGATTTTMAGAITTTTARRAPTATTTTIAPSTTTTTVAPASSTTTSTVVPRPEPYDASNQGSGPAAPNPGIPAFLTQLRALSARGHLGHAERLGHQQDPPRLGGCRPAPERLPRGRVVRRAGPGRRPGPGAPGGRLGPWPRPRARPRPGRCGRRPPRTVVVPAGARQLRAPPCQRGRHGPAAAGGLPLATDPGHQPAGPGRPRREADRGRPPDAAGVGHRHVGGGGAGRRVRGLVLRPGRPECPGFTLTDEVLAPVAEICTRLDGIPLAIELAAARIAWLGPADVADRLEQRFRLLTRGGPIAEARHQTLRAALDWSYGLLSDEEALLFRRMAVSPAAPPCTRSRRCAGARACSATRSSTWWGRW